MPDPRLSAVNNILAILGGRSLDAVLTAADGTADDRDRALAAELSYGVCRWYRRLDALIGALLQRPFKRRDDDLRVLLLVGAYQLLYSRIPPHAALSATVDVTRGLGKGWASRLVNAVLRRVQREHAALGQRVDRDPAVRFAQPDWLYAAICDAWPAQAAAVLDALQQRPPMVIRVDLRQVPRVDYARRLAQAGIIARPHARVGSALVLDSAVAVSRLPGFDQGVVSVQDAGAQLAAGYLDLHPGQRVLDACAAPGGKTLHILQCADLIDMTAVDIDAQRLRRVDQNLRRAGRRADLQVGDVASVADGVWRHRRYDRILVDAPCSATGVMRRHPDIRLLRSASDVVALAERQAAMLDALWPLLQPAGRLLYATCSLLPAENASQIDAFLSRHADAGAVDLPTVAGTRSGKGVQLLPGIDDTDGFFYAALHKAS